MSLRTYFLIAIIVGVLLYVIGMFFSADIVNWANRQQARANSAGQSAIGTVVMEPIKFAVGGSEVGAVVGGLLWPAVPIWLLLILVQLVLLTGVRYVGEVRELTQYLPPLPPLLL